jgi:hypothetical protein
VKQPCAHFHLKQNVPSLWFQTLLRASPSEHIKIRIPVVGTISHRCLYCENLCFPIPRMGLESKTKEWT